MSKTKTLNDLVPAPVSRETGAASGAMLGSRRVHIELANLEDNPWQPRDNFDPVKIAELRSSIEEHGLFQSPLARHKPGDDLVLQLIDGGCRAAALRELRWPTVPVDVVDATDRQMAEWALEANARRNDLNPMERARAYRRLQTEFGASLEEIAAGASCSRPAVLQLHALA